ncbi:MAG: DUF1801 domain-containing protein [Chitinophagaceae bacterium]|jgi:uncharacterized protein YdhG (YjbR/CyaY superfamily)|nr:DUF1801 domain-containing protein [Chitinophagaceae bacterium]
MAKSAKKMLSYCAIKFTIINEYHASLAPEIVKKLDDLRQLILKVIPNVTECIGYNMPTFKLQKNIIHYCAYKKNWYLSNTYTIEFFKSELTEYTI